MEEIDPGIFFFFFFFFFHHFSVKNIFFFSFFRCKGHNMPSAEEQQRLLNDLYEFISLEKKAQLEVKGAKGHDMFGRLCAVVKSGGVTIQSTATGIPLLRFTPDTFQALSNNDRATAGAVLGVELVDEEGAPLTLNSRQYKAQNYFFWRCNCRGADPWLAWQERNKNSSDATKAEMKAATEALNIAPSSSVIFDRAHYTLGGRHHYKGHFARCAPPCTACRWWSDSVLAAQRSAAADLVAKRTNQWKSGGTPLRDEAICE